MVQKISNCRTDAVQVCTLASDPPSAIFITRLHEAALGESDREGHCGIVQYLCIHADGVGVGLANEEVHKIAIMQLVGDTLQQIHEVSCEPLPPVSIRGPRLTTLWLCKQVSKERVLLKICMEWTEVASLIFLHFYLAEP